MSLPQENFGDDPIPDSPCTIFLSCHLPAIFQPPCLNFPDLRLLLSFNRQEPPAWDEMGREGRGETRVFLLWSLSPLLHAFLLYLLGSAFLS